MESDSEFLAGLDETVRRAHDVIARQYAEALDHLFRQAPRSEQPEYPRYSADRW
jgi:hypothetical protein